MIMDVCAPEVMHTEAHLECMRSSCSASQCMNPLIPVSTPKLHIEPWAEERLNKHILHRRPFGSECYHFGSATAGIFLARFVVHNGEEEFATGKVSACITFFPVENTAENAGTLI